MADDRRAQRSSRGELRQRHQGHMLPLCHLPRLDVRRRNAVQSRAGDRGRGEDQSGQCPVGSNCERHSLAVGLVISVALPTWLVPLVGGRNYETYSEDPFVLGTLAAAFINGVLSGNVVSFKANA